MGERLHGMQEVRGSIPLNSTYVDPEPVEGFAKVAELVYALVSKTSGLTAVRVQLPPLALFSIVNPNYHCS